MATNGGRHFEMQLKLNIIKINLFLKSMHNLQMWLLFIM